MASYDAVIKLIVQGEDALKRIQTRVNNLYKTIDDLQSKKKYAGSGAAVEFIREQAEELERVVSVSKQQNKQQELGIKNQIRLNSAVALYERRQRQLARSGVAEQKQFADQLRQIEAGFKFFKSRGSVSGVQAVATELGRIIEYENEINRIQERRYKNQRKVPAYLKEIQKYEAFGLRTDRARKSYEEFSSVASTNQLARAKSYEEALRNQLGLLKQQAAEQNRIAKIAPRSPVRGGLDFPGSPIAVAAEEKAAAKTRDRLLKQQATEQARIARIAPRSPIRGGLNFPGSPIAVAAEEKAAAERATNLLNVRSSWTKFLKEANDLALELRSKKLGASGRARIRQSENLAAYQAAQRRETYGYGGQQLALRPAGFTDQDVRIRNLLDDQKKAAQISSNLKIKLDKSATEAEIQNIQRELDAEIDKIEKVMRAQKKADKELLADFNRRLESRDTQRKERQRISRRNKETLSNAVIGGAFPLLFGQGIGAAAGGAVGGGLGGLAGGQFGFGLSLVGTALGSAIDQFVAQTNELGKALLSVADIVGVLTERSLFSSRELERTAKKLEEAGFAASASAVAQNDLINTIGGKGLQDLQAAGDSSDRLARAYPKLGVQMQALAAGPIAALQNRLANIITNQGLFARGTQVSNQLRRAGQVEKAQRLDQAIQRIQQSPNDLFGLDYEQVRKDLEQVIKEASKNLPKVPVKLDEKQVREELTNVYGKGLESINIVQSLRSQVTAQVRAQEDADRQRYDLIQSSERTIADLRKSIEDRITQQRLSVLQRENELLDLQAEKRLQVLRNANIPLRTQFTDERVSTAANAVADYLEKELEIQNQIEKQKRDTALDIQRINIEVEQYKIQVATQVARLNEDNAKRIADINRGIRRANEDYDSRKFKLEKDLAEIRLAQIEFELNLLATQAAAYGAPNVQKAAADAYTEAQKARKTLRAIQEPAKLREVGAAKTFGVSTAGIDASRGIELLRTIQATKEELFGLAKQGNFDELRAKLEATFDRPLQKAAKDAQNLWDQLLGQDLGARSLEALTRAAAFGEFSAQLQKLKDQVKDVRTADFIQQIIDQQPRLQKEAETVEVSVELLGKLNGKYAELKDSIAALYTPTGQLTQVQQIRNELVRQGIDLESSYAQELLKQAAVVDNLQGRIEKVGTLKDIVGAPLGSAFKDLALTLSGVNNLTSRRDLNSQIQRLEQQRDAINVDALSKQREAEIAAAGTSSITKERVDSAAAAYESYSEKIRETQNELARLGTTSENVMRIFGEMLNKMAETLLNKAAEMIATYTALSIARMLAFGGSPAPVSPTAEGGDLWGAVGRAIGPARAMGGPVVSGTSYLVGENGPELFVPGVSGQVIPNTRTEALMASRQALGGSKDNSASTAFDTNREALGQLATVTRERQMERLITSGATSTEIKYSRVGSGDLPFVTEEDMLQAARVAAQEGARMGQQRTLAALKNNPASRRSIGI